MTDQLPTKTEVLARLDGRYLGEYIGFSGQTREYVSDTLSEAFRADPNPVRRQHHVIQLVQLEYAPYEDAAALLKALISLRQKKTATVLEVLEGYKPGEAMLASVFDECGAPSDEALYSLLDLGAALPIAWDEWFPKLELRKSLKLACRFLTLDCRSNQKKLGVAAYNKSKHGPLVVARGDILGPTIAPLPSMFFANKWPAEFGPNPVIVYGFPDDDEKIEEREKLVHFVQRSLRLIVAVEAIHIARTDCV